MMHNITQIPPFRWMPKFYFPNRKIIIIVREQLEQYKIVVNKQDSPVVYSVQSVKIKLDDLNLIDWIDESQRILIMEEYPIYKELCQNIAETTDIIVFWNTNSSKLPHWRKLFERFSVFHTTSAAAERVNSIVNHTSDQQELLGDTTLEAYAIVKFNRNLK